MLLHSFSYCFQTTESIQSVIWTRTSGTVSVSANDSRIVTMPVTPIGATMMCMRFMRNFQIFLSMQLHTFRSIQMAWSEIDYHLKTEIHEDDDDDEYDYEYEGNSYSSIYEMSLTSNNIVLGDYMKPILNDFQANEDDFDQQMQLAIASSLQMNEITSTDSDDTDSTFSSSKCSKRYRKNRRKTHRQSTSFAQYWQEMSEYNKMLQKNLKYITKQNKNRQKQSKNDKKTEWKGYGTIDSSVSHLLKKNGALIERIPTMRQIYDWLSVRWEITQFRIKNIMTRYVLDKFLKRGNMKNIQIVYHGTGSYNDASIIQKGLVTGGTRGVPIAHGSAHGHGIYCSPSVHTAGSYERGSLFICLVRANKCKQRGDIYVVQNDDDILPIYLASIDGSAYGYIYGAVSRGNLLMSFVPGWKPLNVDVKFKKDRRVKRKWSAYYKLAQK